MKICRFNDNRVGVVRDDVVYDVTAALDDLQSYRYAFPKGDPIIANLDTLRPKMENLANSADGIPVSGCHFLSPVANPTKVIGVPQNYQDHADEAVADVGISQGAPQRKMEDQGLFLKANSALIGPSEGVEIRFPDRRTDHEAELGMIIGRKGSNIAYEEAMSYVAGWSIALDMVVRGKEDRSFRKSVDTYAVLGPWMVTADEIADPGNLDFSLEIANEMRQKNNTRNLILDLPGQIVWASKFYSLHPGDIIMSGTCAGVSRVQNGDVMHLTFEGIGEMDVPVRDYK
ncbi:fumarylacetoacetate hydrolase family protein [Alphaproteobacteria bacterium]|nr:fumarylacetoacetate hydrolase family protein [Alphaproteobacteria bacterium]